MTKAKVKKRPPQSDVIVEVGRPPQPSPLDLLVSEIVHQVRQRELEITEYERAYL
jgi:hypothetical protein